MPTNIQIPIQGDPELKELAEGDETNLLVNGTVESNDGNILTLYVNSASVSEEGPPEEDTEDEAEPEEGTTDEAPTITRTKAVVAKPAGPPAGLAAMMKRGA